MTPQEAIDELKRQGITVSSGSVLEEKGGTFEEFKKATESLLKGSTKGIVNLVGGWGNLYDYLKKSEGPSALSSTGIARGIKKLTGVDIMSIPGYRGTYEFGEAGAPAALMTAAGVPGLFGRTAPGVAGEFAVAGGTGTLASTLAPDSPLAQFAIQSTPYAAAGAVRGARTAANAPSGTVPGNVDDLLRVGRMTPGEATGNRPQLAREASMEVNPKILERGNEFRMAQAGDVEGFLGNLFNRVTSQAVPIQDASTAAFTAFQNYGKALSSRLRGDAARDFGKAKNSGGTINTQPVYDAVAEQLAKLPAEVPQNAALRASLQKILDEYVIPGTPASVTPSTILGPTGQPATVNITPAVPASLQPISIDRLQKNLSAWGEAAYSGKADFGKGNIFEGVAPGQAKGVALTVLRSFKQALDDAIAAGVPGADQLKIARDRFSANLDKIGEFAERPLTKYFDKERATDLTPEDVIAKLSTAKPSERLFLSQVLANSPANSAIFDTVRRSQFEALLEKARKAAAGAPEGAPEIDLKTLQKELFNKKGDFNYLFNNDAKAAQDALLAIEWLKKVNKTATDFPDSFSSNAFGATRGLGGTSQQGFIVRELASIVQLIVDDPKALSKIVFDPETVSKMAKLQREGKLVSGLKTAQDLTTSLAKYLTLRGSPMFVTDAPTDTSVPAAVPQEPGGMSAEEALRQLQDMGIPVQ
jgi:hypothetical protein